ncbi:MAG: thiamine diphosphokinase [Chloroflexota bacterium]
MPRVLIFANGHLPDLAAARTLIRADDILLAADGGTRRALALGLIPSVVIGDLDSISQEERQKVEEAGVRLIQHPRDKNETDLELALQFAIEQNHREIVIVAALGDRLDQTLANIALLTDLRLSTFDLKLDDGVEEAFFCRDRAEVRGRGGDLVSLIPWGGAATGVRTAGLKWPLSGETLFPEKTRGISNEMLGATAHIEIVSGLLLIIHRRQS